jgi:hypothetical protein
MSKFLFLHIQNTTANNASTATEVNDILQQKTCLLVCVCLCGYQPLNQQSIIAETKKKLQNCCSFYELHDLSGL